jgi:hypothetical protein
MPFDVARIEEQGQMPSYGSTQKEEEEERENSGIHREDEKRIIFSVIKNKVRRHFVARDLANVYSFVRTIFCCVQVIVPN